VLSRRAYNWGMRRGPVPIHRRLPRWPALAAACTVGLAACGVTTGSSGTTSASANGGPALQFAKCMRAHGVSGFPDPSAQGVQIQGLDPNAPVFQAAQKACAKYGPSPDSLPKPTAAEQRAALRFAECMRVHGVPNFPDPLSAPPSLRAPVLALRGMIFAVGSGIQPRSPAFQQAAAACGLKLPHVSAGGV
jgi:hypothetical protein